MLLSFTAVLVGFSTSVSCSHHLIFSVADPDPGSGMFIPDHISESIETIFWVKILNFLVEDPGSGAFLTLDPGWKNSDPG